MDTRTTMDDAPSVPARVPHLLGATFLIVIGTSLAGGLMLRAAIGNGSAADILASVATNADVLRAAVLIDLVTSLGIVALAALLYVVLRSQSPALALIALGWWLLEAAFMAISRTGALVLIPVSQAVAGGGIPEPSAYQALGASVNEGIVSGGYTVHMFFYCAGGIIWYSLLYRSGYVPHALSLLGVAAVVVGLGGIALELFGASVPMAVFLPILAFELIIGAWLLVRGIETGTSVASVTRPGAIETGRA